MRSVRKAIKLSLHNFCCFYFAVDCTHVFDFAIRKSVFFVCFLSVTHRFLFSVFCFFLWLFMWERRCTAVFHTFCYCFLFRFREILLYAPSETKSYSHWLKCRLVVVYFFPDFVFCFLDFYSALPFLFVLSSRGKCEHNHVHLFLQMLFRHSFTERRLLSTTTRSVSPVHFPYGNNDILSIRRSEQFFGDFSDYGTELFFRCENRKFSPMWERNGRW